MLALALATGTGYAANGDRLVLGEKNTAKKSTVLKNTKRVPLKLVAKKGKPALKVNTKKKIKNLNADRLDGLHKKAFLRKGQRAADSARLGGRDASAYALANGQTGVRWATGGVGDVPGKAYASATAQCPAGTVMTGGGGYTKYSDDKLWFSGPGAMPHSWEVNSDGNKAARPGDQLLAYVVCFNARGPVPGAMSFPSLREQVMQLRAER